MEPKQLAQILSSLARVNVGILGDFCLDAYWSIQEDFSGTSVETGKPVTAISNQRYGLGGAGNVAVNLAAMGVKSPLLFGVLGAKK